MKPRPASKAELNALRKLSSPQERDETRLILVEGPTLIAEALSSSLPPRTVLAAPSYLSENVDATEVFETAARAGATALTASPSALSRVARTKSPVPIVATFSFQLPDPADFEWDTVQTAIMLHEVQDPGNVGACVRVAEAAGVDLVVVSPCSAHPLGSRAIRGSAGSAFRQRLIVDGTIPTVQRMRHKGLKIWAAVSDKAIDYREETFVPPAAVVLGNEGHGIGDTVLAECGGRVQIPLSGRVESLNVAVAAALLMFRLCGG